ncbi:hypothetical protein ABFS82_12G089100 [Erythranthe guttata]
MFDSQLSQVKHENCVFDPGERNMTMKENQNATFYDSNGFVKEIDPPIFGSKEIYKLNDSKMDANLLETKDRDECWHHKVMDDISEDSESGTVDSPKKEVEDVLLIDHLSGSDKDLDSLSSNTCDKDKERQNLGHENMPCNGNESQDSSPPCNSASGLSQTTDANLFTDKNVLECGMPEFEVFCKEIDYQIVKDICVDEGRPDNKDKITESCKDDKSDGLFHQPTNSNHSEITITEANQCGTKEENDGKSPSDTSFDEDTAKKDCDPAKSVQTSEITDNQEEDSLVGIKPPVQELVTRNSLRSFLYPLGDEGGVVTQPPDQILNEKPASRSSAATSSSAEAEGVEEDVEASSSVLYNSEVESGTITFNFDSTVTENMKPQDSVDSSSVTSNNIDCVGSSKDREDENEKNSEQNEGSSAIISRQMKYEEGETSFAAASLVTYSGPIAYSGSLSLRSDGSAASGRSFAFPILQSEWNSSPVRMAKADRRHFRKHKGWRSGLLCCRF